MESINITELGERTGDAHMALGIREDTVWSIYYRAIQPIVKWHLAHGKAVFEIFVDAYNKIGEAKLKYRVPSKHKKSNNTKNLHKYQDLTFSVLDFYKGHADRHAEGTP